MTESLLDAANTTKPIKAIQRKASNSSMNKSARLKFEALLLRLFEKCTI